MSQVSSSPADQAVTQYRRLVARGIDRSVAQCAVLENIPLIDDAVVASVVRALMAVQRNDAEQAFAEMAAIRTQRA